MNGQGLHLVKTKWEAKLKNSLQSLNDLVDVNFVDAYGGEMHIRLSLFPVFRREPHFLP